MISPRFYLKNPKADSSQLILMIIRKKGGGSLKISTERHIHPSLWEQENQKPIKRKTAEYRAIEKDNPHLKVELQNTEIRLNRMIEDAILFADQIEREHGTLDYAELKRRLDEAYKPKPKQASEPENDWTILSYAEQFVKEIEAGTIKTEKGSNFSRGTIKSWKSWLGNWKSFVKQNGFNPRFSELTKEVCQLYLEFLQFKGYKEALRVDDLELRSVNDIGKNIKVLKALCNRTLDEGLHSQLAFKKLKSYKAQTKNVVLSEDELEILYSLKLSGEQELYRDVFLCGCYTALRYSDYSRISKNQIREVNGRKTLRIYTKKTKQEINIPINSKLEKILSKYNYSLPKNQEQKLNDLAKEICREAGFDQSIEIPKHTGKGTTYVTLPKYKLISSHTARRTAATIMYLKGLRLNDIAKITGHSSEANLKKYLVLDDEQVTDILANNPFFR